MAVSDLLELGFSLHTDEETLMKSFLSSKYETAHVKWIIVIIGRSYKRCFQS